MSGVEGDTIGCETDRKGALTEAGKADAGGGVAVAVVSWWAGIEDTGGVEMDGVDFGGVGGATGFETEEDDELDDILLEADREGPSLAATNADLSTNDLNSYFAKPTHVREHTHRHEVILRTANVFLEITITFRVDHVRRRWISRLVWVVIFV